jgi:hypothetical protein
MPAKSSNHGNVSESDLLRVAARWRDDLARSIALRNPGIGPAKASFAARSILEEIIFLRLCEARSGCTSSKLGGVLNSDGIYHQLCELLASLDYIVVDDEALKKAIFEICLQGSCDFSAMPPNILGRIHEHLLGSEICLPGPGSAPAGKRQAANIRKASGIYYTPDYIIDYIVEGSLNNLLRDRNPDQASEIKILDPACGCGSFLTIAYRHLLDWHLNWHLEKLESENKSAASKSKGDRRFQNWPGGDVPESVSTEKLPVARSRDGTWRLTIAEKKRILQNSIFGVDIDPQAVELTKRSLQLMLHEKSLPGDGMQLSHLDLRNIKCGNALVGPGFSDAWEDCDEGVRAEDGKFNWQVQFPEAMKSGGFDAVIGNPPYVRQEVLSQSEGLKGYLKDHYQVYHGAADLYSYFIERGVSLLKPGGVLSYVTANKWMRTSYGLPLRRWMKGLRVLEVVDFGDLPIFKKASAYPCILTISKEPPGLKPRLRASKVRGSYVTKPSSSEEMSGYSCDKLSRCYCEEFGKCRYEVDISCLEDAGWTLTGELGQALLCKIRSRGVPLGTCLEGKIHRGVLTGMNRAFVIDQRTRDRLIQEDPGSKELIKPVVSGKEIKRYHGLENKKFLIFSRQGTDIEKYPAIKRHLEKFREDLEPKTKETEAKSDGFKAGEPKGRKPGRYRWHEIQDPIVYHKKFEEPKIVLPDISKSGNFTLDPDGKIYCLNNAYLISSQNLCLLAILNSSLITFFCKAICSTCRGGYLRFTLQYLKQLPIYMPEASCTEDQDRCLCLADLAKEMLELHVRLAESKHDEEKAQIQEQISDTEIRIDDLVCELYGLTEEEADLVKKSA